MFDTLKEILHKVAKSRIFVLCVVMILLSSTLIGRLFYLQIIKGEEYQDNYSLKIQKPRILNGSRGNIYDRNGNLLAYNELANSVTIEDNGSYDKRLLIQNFTILSKSWIKTAMSLKMILKSDWMMTGTIIIR